MSTVIIGHRQLPTLVPMLPATVEIAGEQLMLHPHRALWWARMRWLVVADLHLGKAAHFRKAGIPLPEGSDAVTLQRLDTLIQDFQPSMVILLGDLFHSAHNQQWEAFAFWCKAQTVPIHLVLGNHDILADRRYQEACLTVHTDTIEEGPFVFTHEPADRPGTYVIAGHVHPGVKLQGLVHGPMRLPCFLFGETQALLPAFGTSTGLFIMTPALSDRVFAVTDRSVLDVTTGMERARQTR
jgi:uncharacterized protein